MFGIHRNFPASTGNGEDVNARPVLGSRYNASEHNIDSAVTWADSNIMSGCIAFTADAGSGAAVRFALHMTDDDFLIGFISSGAVRVYARNPGGTVVVDLRTTTTGLDDGLWHTLLWSFNLSTGAYSLYLDGVEDADAVTMATGSGPVDLNGNALAVGAATPGSNDWDGNLAWLAISTSEYLDFSSSTVRNKFIYADGSPKWLGNDGTYTGGFSTQPEIWLPHGVLQPNFGTVSITRTSGVGTVYPSTSFADVT